MRGIVEQYPDEHHNRDSNEISLDPLWRSPFGAGRSVIFRMVLSEGLSLTLIGLSCGLVLSLAATRLLRGVLFGVAANDMFTFASVVGVLAGISLVSCFMPAWCASRMSPVAALRMD